jgi:hypothetical protein
MTNIFSGLQLFWDVKSLKTVDVSRTLRGTDSTATTNTTITNTTIS